MAMMKFKGVNEMAITPLARLVFEEILTRLLTAKEDKEGRHPEYMATAKDIADKLNFLTGDVKASLKELMEHGLIVAAHPFGECNGLDLNYGRIAVFAEIIEYRGSAANPAQAPLPVDEPEPRKPREEVGHDDAMLDGRWVHGIVDAVEGDKPFELTIGEGEFYEPFRDEEPVVLVEKMPFGSKEEAWAYFDQYCGKAPEGSIESVVSDGIWHGSEGTVFTIKYSVLDSEVCLEISILESDYKPFSLVGLIASLESEDYVWSEVYAFATRTWGEKPPDTPLDMKMLEDSTRQALAYALAIATSPSGQDSPSEDQPDPLPAAEVTETPKRGRKKGS